MCRLTAAGSSLPFPTLPVYHSNMDPAISSDPLTLHLVDLLDLAIKVLILALLAATLKRGNPTKVIMLAALLTAAGCNRPFILSNDTAVGPLGVHVKLDLAAGEPDELPPTTPADTSAPSEPSP